MLIVYSTIPRNLVEVLSHEQLSKTESAFRHLFWISPHFLKVVSHLSSFLRLLTSFVLIISMSVRDVLESSLIILHRFVLPPMFTWALLRKTSLFRTDASVDFSWQNSHSCTSVGENLRSKSWLNLESFLITLDEDQTYYPFGWSLCHSVVSIWQILLLLFCVNWWPGTSWHCTSKDQKREGKSWGQTRN